MNRRQGSGEFPMHPLTEPERPPIENEPQYRLVGKIATEVWRAEPTARRTAARLKSIAHAYAKTYAGMNLYHAHRAAVLALHPHERAAIGEE
jgi:hypothetical protein